MIVFEIISILAIAAGGLLSAFTAKKPTRLTSWTSAYLVLVTGLLQLGIITSWHNLAIGAPGLAILAMILYNLGSLLVIIGRAIKGRSKWSVKVVAIGAALLVVAGLRLFLSAQPSNQTGAKIWLFILLLVVLLSAIAGLTMSIRSHQKIHQPKAT